MFFEGALLPFPQKTRSGSIPLVDGSQYVGESAAGLSGEALVQGGEVSHAVHAEGVERV